MNDNPYASPVERCGPSPWPRYSLGVYLLLFGISGFAANCGNIYLSATLAEAIAWICCGVLCIWAILSGIKLFEREKSCNDS